MNGNRFSFFISIMIVIFTIIIAGFIRFRKRNSKSPEEIKRSKRISWILYILAMLFFFVTIILYENILNG